MDDHLFDHWTRALGSQLDRRGATRLAAVVLGALSAGLSFADDAGAKKKKKKKKKKKSKKNGGLGSSPPPPPNSPPGSPPASPPASPAAPWPRTYQGVAELQVQLANFSGQPLGVQTYQTAVRIEVQAPHARETNPFRLTLWPMQIVNASGEVSLHSGYVYDGVFFQFWTYAFDPQATSDFGGRLTDNRALQALALNIMTIPTEIAPHITLPYSVSIATGAEMLGRFQGNQIGIVVQGNSSYGTNPFILSVLGNQVG